MYNDIYFNKNDMDYTNNNINIMLFNFIIYFKSFEFLCGDLWVVTP